MSKLIPIETIENRIFLIRGQKVMIDKDLAELYGVPTSRLNEQVKRNIERFPEDFMFQLKNDEYENLISHFATSSWGGRRKLPYAFTEHGVAMLSSVLRSKRAIMINIFIIKAFIRLRNFLSTHKELAQKLAELEKKVEGHDEEIRSIFDAIRQLMSVPEKPKKKIGFIVDRQK